MKLSEALFNGALLSHARREGFPAEQPMVGGNYLFESAEAFGKAVAGFGCTMEVRLKLRLKALE